MILSARPFTTGDSTVWEDLVGKGWNASFLHTRRFLSYHRDRFEDASLVIEDEQRRVVAVFPAALDPQDERRIISHPGSTYGGMVHAGALKGMRMVAALEAVTSTYRSMGRHVLRYKAVPTIYHRIPAEDDIFALLRMGAQFSRSDLASVIDLQNRPRIGKGRRSYLAKASRSGVTVDKGSDYLSALWSVVEENLRTRHGVRPTHSLPEITELQDLFPEQIECVVGKLDGEVVGGTLIFRLGHVAHTQYIASYPRAREHSVLDLVLEETIVSSFASEHRYFSFGTSMERDGSLNEGLHQFKSQFGAGAVVHHVFDLAL